MDNFSGFVLISALVLVLVVIWGAVQHSNMMLSSPCSEFRNYSINNIPVRCISELGMKLE